MTRLSKVFREYVPKHKWKGVLHVGGYHGEESEVYKQARMEMLFFEPIPEHCEIIKQKGLPVVAAAVGIHLTEGGVLYVDEERTTTQKPLRYAYKEKRECPTGVLLKEYEEAKYELLVIDAQVSTLNILKSAHLKHIKTIIAEVSKKPRYEGEASWKEVTQYLLDRGYQETTSFRHGKADIYDVVYWRTQ